MTSKTMNLVDEYLQSHDVGVGDHYTLRAFAKWVDDVPSPVETAREQPDDLQPREPFDDGNPYFPGELRRRQARVTLDRLRTEMLEVNKALGLDRDNQDNALRVKTALRLRLPEEPSVGNCQHGFRKGSCTFCIDSP